MKQNLPSATFLEKVDPLNPRWRRARFAVITTSGIFYVPPASVDSTLTTHYLSLFYDDFCSRALIPLFFVSYFIFYSKINS